MTEWQVKHGKDLLSSIIFPILFYLVKNLKMRYINFVALPNSIYTLLCLYWKTSLGSFASKGEFLCLL